MKIEELHEKLFEHLLFFDKLCRENGIKYFLDSGTAIGAVREHDFIQWDDDVDVAMLREDYEKFLKAVVPNLPKNFVMVTPKDYEPLFLDFIPKFLNMDVQTKKDDELTKMYHNSISRLAIDIIILDYAPNSKMLQKIMKFKLLVIYCLSLSKRGFKPIKKYSFFENIVSKIGIFIGGFFTMEQLNKMRDKVLKKYKDTNWLIRGNPLVNYIGFYPKKCYEKTVLMDFHGVKMPIACGYDEILTKLYGDYMIPPKDKSIYEVHADID